MTETVLELYSIRDAARLFRVPDSRLRYWIQTGFVRPSLRQGGRFYYSFSDLVGLKAAVELLAAGVPLVRVRKALAALKGALPAGVAASSRLRVASDGETLVVVSDGTAWEPQSGQLVMSFAIASLGGQVAEMRARAAEEEPEEGAPEVVEGGPTEPVRTSAYQSFLDGCRAEEAGDLDLAEICYRRALDAEPSLAAAHTNLGNLAFRRGDRPAARRAYERALDLDPDQPEARFNLANLLDEMGDTEMAVSELRAVCSRHPGFADAHYNLGLLLARLGGISQAQQHLARYVALDPTSEWAAKARDLLAQVG
jgi:tetratricopeptide (TPR) repeat protein